jgi:diaminopimelate epimerase
MKFAKLEGLKNDFMVTHETGLDFAALRRLAPALCDRRSGIGADGILILDAPTIPSADWRMQIINADGSEAEMCGNGIRCAVVYLSRLGLSRKNALMIETLAGQRAVELRGDQVRVEMGRPILESVQPLIAGDQTFSGQPVSMGNPHLVTYADRLTDDLVLTYGPRLSAHPLFPQHTNVEFVHVISDREIEMRVYERGCGETPACGTGACAAVAAGVSQSRHGTAVTVHLPGGDLLVEWAGLGSPVTMTGPARWVFSGEIDLTGGL